MRHAQLHVATITLGPRPLPLRHGTLQVVDRGDDVETGGRLDWELVLHTIDVEPVAPGVHPLSFDLISGTDRSGRLSTSPISGTAVLVRAVEHALVFRGGSELDGFDERWLG